MRIPKRLVCVVLSSVWSLMVIADPRPLLRIRYREFPTATPTAKVWRAYLATVGHVYP